MSTRVFTLPDLGEGLTEAEVVRWLVAVGDVLEVDQPVVEVETAKSIVEVPTPYAGTVATLHGAEGASIDVGRPLISVETLDAVPPAADVTADVAAASYREEERAGSGSVLIGYGTSDEAPVAGRRRRPRDPSPLRQSVTGQSPSAPAREASPVVRRLARDAGVTVGEVTGTGPDGIVTGDDVRSAAEPGTTEGLGRTGLAVAERVPLSGFRRAVSAAMSRSRSEIPEATVWVDVDFTELFALRATLAATGVEVPSLLAYLARFTVAALVAHPDLNAEIDPVRHELVRYDGINLGLAVQTARGLVVPAVREAHLLTTAALDAEIRRVTQSTREGRSRPAELTSGTFTLNNYGGFRVDGSAAIIHHPQVAMLGFGRVIDRAWVVDGELAVRKIAQMSFVFDHRVCDGGTAASFMRSVADAIETPGSLLSRV